MNNSVISYLCNYKINLKEITLRKSCSDERLGLTVAYSTNPISGGGSSSDDTNDLGTEVYISEIIPDSVAHRDGRLRQGDQILQVNGRDVSTKEETELLFAENRNAVTLLVSRCLYQRVCMPYKCSNIVIYMVTF